MFTIIATCSECGAIRRITKSKIMIGEIHPKVKSGARIKHINPKKCKNRCCQLYQERNPDMSYSEFVKVEKLDDSRIKFLQLD